jgi:hypothetical protein
VELTLSIDHRIRELAGSYIGLSNSLDECCFAFEINTMMLMRIENPDGKIQFLFHNLYGFQ